MSIKIEEIAFQKKETIYFGREFSISLKKNAAYFDEQKGVAVFELNELDSLIESLKRIKEMAEGMTL